MLEKRTVSQCISSDYCRGWNDAVDEATKEIERLRAEKEALIKGQEKLQKHIIKLNELVGDNNG